VSVFTEHEDAYLRSQRLARLATASTTGAPDVAAVTFGVDGDTIVSGGYDITKTVRYGNLKANPRAVIVIDDLASTDPGRLAASRSGEAPSSRNTTADCRSGSPPRSSGPWDSTPTARTTSSACSEETCEVPVRHSERARMGIARARP